MMIYDIQIMSYYYIIIILYLYPLLDFLKKYEGFPWPASLEIPTWFFCVAGKRESNTITDYNIIIL